MRRGMALLLAILLIAPMVSAEGWAVKYTIKDATFIYPGQPLLSSETLYMAGVYEVNYTKGKFYLIALDAGSRGLKFGEELVFELNGTPVKARGLTEGSHGIIETLPNGNLLVSLPANRQDSSSFSAIVVAELRRDGKVMWARYYQLSGRHRGKIVPKELMPVDLLVTNQSIYILAQSITWQRPVTVLLRLSLNGTLLWAKSFTTTDVGAEPVGIELSPNGELLMLVSVMRPLLFWLDGNGNITKGIAINLWETYLLNGLLVKDGNIYIIGSIKPKLYEPFILALDSDGKPLWAEKFPKSGYTFLSLHFDGDFYILGNAGSALQEGGDEYRRHVWVLSVDRNGKPRWNVVTGDSMVMNELGGIALGGLVYVTYYRNFMMDPGLVFLAIDRGGLVPCPADTPELNPEVFDVSTEIAGPIKIGEAIVDSLPLKVELRKLNLSKKNLCPGEGMSIPSPEPGSKTSTTSPIPYTQSGSSAPSTRETTSSLRPSGTSTVGNSSPKTSSTAEKSGICGPAFIVVFSLLPLLRRRG